MISFRLNKIQILTYSHKNQEQIIIDIVLLHNNW